MNRRTFFSGALVGLGGLAGQTQDSAVTPQGRAPAVSGDPLFNPGAVQQRAAATDADNDAVVQGLERRLKCTCPCNLDIYTCRTTDFTCSYSPALHLELLELRRAGKSETEVVDVFIAKYGERILMAPEPKGFNLTGYLVPGTVLLLAGGLLAGVLLRRGRVLAAAGTASMTAPDMVNDVIPGSPGDGHATIEAEDAERLRRALAEVED
jgi:cytochrome c-type biogenesis protein CcmH